MGFDAGRFEQTLGHMGFVFLLAGGGKRRRMAPPAAVGILRLHEPVGGETHRVAIASEGLFRRSETEQDLSCVESDGHDRLRIDPHDR